MLRPCLSSSAFPPPHCCLPRLPACSLLQGAPGEAEALRGQLAEALRENQLLKRAVAIQNARMQELR